MVSPYETISFQILGSTVESSPCKELLGIIIDSELTFHKHVISLYSEANRKVSALARIAKYLTIDKQNILTITAQFIYYSTIYLLRTNSFIATQFDYCPVIGISHSRTLNNEINRMQEQALRVVCNDYK